MGVLTHRDWMGVPPPPRWDWMGVSPVRDWMALGQVIPGAVLLLRFPAGGLPCQPSFFTTPKLTITGCIFAIGWFQTDRYFFSVIRNTIMVVVVVVVVGVVVAVAFLANYVRDRMWVTWYYYGSLIQSIMGGHMERNSCRWNFALQS